MRQENSDEVVAGLREGVARLCCRLSASVNHVADHSMVGCRHDDG